MWVFSTFFYWLRVSPHWLRVLFIGFLFCSALGFLDSFQTWKKLKICIAQPIFGGLVLSHSSTPKTGLAIQITSYMGTTLLLFAVVKNYIDKYVQTSKI